MHLNANFNQRAVVRFDGSEWVASPKPRAFCDPVKQIMCVLEAALLQN